MPDTIKTEDKNLADDETIKEIKSATYVGDFLENVMGEKLSALYKGCSDKNKKDIVEIIMGKLKTIQTSTKIGDIEDIIKFIKEGKSYCKEIGINHSYFCDNLKSNGALKKKLLNYLINTKGAFGKELSENSNPTLFQISGMDEKTVSDMACYSNAELLCENCSSEMSLLKTKLDKTYNHLREAHSKVYNIELDLEEAKEEFDGINNQFKTKREEYNEKCSELRESISKIIESLKNLKKFLNTNGITTEGTGIDNIVKNYEEFLKTYTLIEIKAN